MTPPPMEIETASKEERSEMRKLARKHARNRRKGERKWLRTKAAWEAEEADRARFMDDGYQIKREDELDSRPKTSAHRVERRIEDRRGQRSAAAFSMGSRGHMEIKREDC